MGAAMAPAAVDTIRQHFEDFGRKPQDYDLIVTGDLGVLGKQIVLEQMRQDGFDLTGRYDDCGVKMCIRDSPFQFPWTKYSARAAKKRSQFQQELRPLVRPFLLVFSLTHPSARIRA